MKSHATFELLESRRLASVSLGTNLLQNGDAENAEGGTTPNMVLPVPGWKVTGNFTIVEYDSTGFPDHGTPGSDDRGRNFFAGGKTDGTTVASSATQDVNVSSLATDIDAGRIKYDLSAWLGGWKREDDEITMCAAFLNTTNPPDKTSGWLIAHGPDADDRGGLTAFALRSMRGTVPSGTRTIRVALFTRYRQGAYIDGYADDVSLTLSSKAAPNTGFVTGNVFNDGNGNGKKNTNDKALAGVTVFADVDGDGKLDAGEPNAATDASGAYLLAKVPMGSVSVQLIALAGFRASSAATQKVNVTAGLTAAASPFLATQTSLISGKVLWDNGEPFEGRTIYIDGNGNGALDAGETASRIDAKGRFSLVAPRGSYTLRVTDVTGVVPLKVRVGKGQFSSGHVITIPPQ
jgi:hypothetical protein